MKTSALILVCLLALISSTVSTGFLSFKLTTDIDCLINLEHSSGEYSETVRLLAYETRFLEIWMPSSQLKISIDFQFLHHFSGVSLSSKSNTLEFELDNNGVIESKVIDAGQLILSVQSIFTCDQGFFGPNCERRSKTISTTTSTPAIKEPTNQWKSAVISNDIIIYVSLAFLVLLLIIANCVLCFCRSSKPSKYMEETFPFEYLTMNGTPGTQFSQTGYFDAASRFLTSTTSLQSRV